MKKEVGVCGERAPQDDMLCEFDAHELDAFDRGLVAKYGVGLVGIRSIRRKALRRAAQQDVRPWLTEQRRSPARPPLPLVVMTMLDDKLAVLDLYERYTTEGEMFLTGAFGGVKLFIHPIKGADPDDRSWRLYPAPRLQGVDLDRARPTSKTKSAPTGWAGARERQSLTKTLAAVGMAAPFYQDELDLDDQP